MDSLAVEKEKAAKKAAEKRAARKADTESVLSTNGRRRLKELDTQLEGAEDKGHPKEIMAATLKRERERDKAKAFDDELRRQDDKERKQRERIRGTAARER